MTPEIFKKEIHDIFNKFTGIRIIFIVRIEDGYSLKLSKIDAAAMPKILDGFKRKLSEDIIRE
ncbi:hypothetical protein SAMN03159428_03809 [Kosakonia radicincitans]|uniref:Uncharacterized protein n=1 Tax=Kosakonia radicincitans TaxID=283686 RepID=A0AAX2EY64_9ENTR|nr:hypothetical protein [Kosakonia radicincitans]SFF25566.1 hypothetical protein SAMN03159468_04346 [Kosakonia radicincitans]SFR25072.1 hypothetical protein SAMN03159514_04536 [Kosakonia radicincitans]SFU06334.1 hypothetical protein SAMN03159428_03809 [Kosakonia radicincitans]SFY06563.1 hypothetical protein SAMN03159436_03644 [Kosakonia radicincitans]